MNISGLIYSLIHSFTYLCNDYVFSTQMSLVSILVLSYQTQGNADAPKCIYKDERFSLFMTSSLFIWEKLISSYIITLLNDKRQVVFWGT
jgi:hypothetical protein